MFAIKDIRGNVYAVQDGMQRPSKQCRNLLTKLTKGVKIMIVRIHETDFKGRPRKFTGDYYQGKSAINIVERVMLNPFTSGMKPMEYMRSILNRIGQEKFLLPEDDEEKAAEIFLQRMVDLGYAMYYRDTGRYNEEGYYVPGTPIEEGKV